MRIRVAAIVPAAGSGHRLGLKIKKPFVLLKGKPLISYTLRALDSSPSIDGIIVAADRPSVKRLRRLIKRYRLKKVIDVVAGGPTRYESVRNCLKKVDASYDIVLVHDGARPFVEEAVISGSINMASKFGACIVAVPESDTVKLVDKCMFINKTMDRAMIYRAGTPQVFRRRIIKTAYGLKRADNVTDDASLVERLGVKVKVLKGPYSNIKITTREDLKMAEALL